MNEYRCPYCSKDFTNWKSVRGHLPSCKLRDGKYYISLELGVIDLRPICNFSIIEYDRFISKFNSTERNSILKAYKKYLNIGNKSFGINNKEAFIQIAKDFYRDRGRVPISRDYKITVGKYLPTPSLIQRVFGSWNKYIEEAGLPISKVNGFGIPTKGEDSILYRSTLEANFVNKFLFNKYNYEYEKQYPNINRYCDYYLAELDLYIEVAGGLRPEVIEEKINFCIKNKLNLLIFYPKDMKFNSIQDILNHRLIKRVKSNDYFNT